MYKYLLVFLSLIVASSGFSATKLYGEFHGSYDTHSTVTNTDHEHLALNNSEIGVKGSFEVQEDISFIYQLAVGANTSGFDRVEESGIENRNQVVGLASPSGAVIVGRFYTPFKSVGKKADLFWHSQLGQNRNVTNAKNWDSRADSIILVQSPKSNGFQGTLAYASDLSDVAGSTKDASAISANVYYKKGHYFVAAGYEQQDLVGFNGDRKALRLSSAYQDGPLKLVGFYQKEDNNSSETSESNAQVIGLGIALKRGKGTIKSQWYKRDAENAAGNQDLFALGYDYKVSENLDVYGQFVKNTNAIQLGRNGVGSNSNNGVAGNIQGVSAGVRLKF